MRAGEAEAVEAAAIRLGHYSAAQWERWSDTPTAQTWLAEARSAVDAAYPIIAAAVRAETEAELRAENAALHESLNVTAERAAGDRRALHEAQETVRRAKIVAREIEAAILQLAKDGAPEHIIDGVTFIGLRLRAALAAAQPVTRTHCSECRRPISTDDGSEERESGMCLRCLHGPPVAAAQPTESAPR